MTYYGNPELIEKYIDYGIIDKLFDYFEQY